MSQLPYLTANLPGIGGLLKQHAEDFIVHEVPLYPAKGVGTHCYFRVEKRNISTMRAADLLARGLGRKTLDIGYAGLKDTRAVTTQWFSIEHEDSARVRGLEIPGLKIVEITRHNNKIKMGHLAGNRFVIKLRNPEWDRAGATLDESLARANAIWAVLQAAGVPNFFGPQRFGMRKDNHMLGMALLKDDAQGFMNRFLGDPDESIDHGSIITARYLYAKGKLREALELWPGHLANERRALVALIKSPDNPKKAVFSVDLKLKQLLISALQSHLFNQVLTRRLPQFTHILPGDLCWKHDNGACFAIGPNPDDAMKEQPRADAHEISPSGPLFGHKMTETQSLVKVMEDSVLAENHLSLEAFGGPAGSHGGRRAMRFFPTDFRLLPTRDERGPTLQFDFTLPSGSYATTFLAEFMKAEVNLD